LKESTSPDLEVYRNVVNALGDASTFIGNFDEAANCYQIVLDLTDDDPQETALFHYKLGRLHFYQDNVEAANRNYQQALEITPHNSNLVAQIDAELRLLYDLG
jgi:tetratricopeptide (TPR) repeat protein